MIGSKISHYTIIEKAAAGGMGVVYKARDVNLDRIVAIKLLPEHLSRDQEATKRFIHEARAASALDHPNIGTIYEIDTTDEGLTFIAMAYYEGETLRERIDRGGIAVEETLAICCSIAAGLDKAHRSGIVHRDIKPANILFGSDNEVKIVDFGLAKLEGRSRLTREGTTLGTAAYMSPEQAQGLETDGRSDIFSLGVILYEMLAGGLPFRGEHEAALLYGIVHQEPEPLPEEISRDWPAAVQLIRRSLAKEPSARYGSADELKSELETCLGRSSSTTLPGVVRSRRRRLPLILSAALIVILASVLIWQQVTKETDTTTESEDLSWISDVPVMNWILVADFDGPADDPQLAKAVRSLVEAPISESRIVTPLSRANIRAGLEMALLPDTTAIIGETAMELAYRAGAEAFIEGSVEKAFGGYVVLVNLVETETGNLLFSLKATSADDAGMFAEMERLGAELLEKLGENADELARRRRSSDVSTGSLDAYRLYEEAVDLRGKMQYTLEMEKLDAALRIDPDFAIAWYQKSMIYSNWGLVDSMLYASKEAWRHKERMTEKNRLSMEIWNKLVYEYDYAAVVELSSRMVKEYGTSHTILAIALYYMGRLEDAYVVCRSAAEYAPFGATDILVANAADLAMLAGHYEESQKYIDRIEGEFRRKRSAMLLALALSRWAEAENIFLSIFEDHSHEMYAYFPEMHISRGSVRSEDLELDAIPGNRMEWFSAFNQWNLLRIAGIEMDLSLLSDSVEKNIRFLIILGVQAAASGNTDVARKYLEAAGDRPAHEQNRHKTDITVLEAWIEKSIDNHDETIRMLQPHINGGRIPFIFGRAAIRWLVAESLEASGRYEHAVEAYELVLSPLHLCHERDLYPRPAYVSLTHRKLAILYSRLGEPEEARKHLTAFEEMFTDPDPELVRLLETARSAVHGN